MRRAVVVICTMAERGLAFRVTNEQFGFLQNGYYLGLLDLICQFHPFLSSHIAKYENSEKGNISYLSKTKCEELIDIMSKKSPWSNCRWSQSFRLIQIVNKLNIRYFTYRSVKRCVSIWRVHWTVLWLSCRWKFTLVKVGLSVFSCTYVKLALLIFRNAEVKPTMTKLIYLCATRTCTKIPVCYFHTLCCLLS